MPWDPSPDALFQEYRYLGSFGWYFKNLGVHFAAIPALQLTAALSELLRRELLRWSHAVTTEG